MPKDLNKPIASLNEIEKNIMPNDLNKPVLSLNKNTMSSKDISKNNSGSKNLAPQGILRYININKRKISPQQTPEKKQKNSDDPLKNNRFALLSNDNSKDESRTPEIMAAKPTPIFLRETGTSELVKVFTDLIGKNTFHIVPLVYLSY